MSSRRAKIVLLAGELFNMLPRAIGDRTQEKSLLRIDDVAKHFPIPPADDVAWPGDFASGCARHAAETLKPGPAYNNALVALLAAPKWSGSVSYVGLADRLIDEQAQRAKEPDKQKLVTSLALDFLAEAATRAPQDQRDELAQRQAQLRGH